MKLSKAQQAVVEMMREGWELSLVDLSSINCRLRKDGKKIRVMEKTVRSLYKQRIIHTDKIVLAITYYLLTEQYKTAKNENSNT